MRAVHEFQAGEDVARDSDDRWLAAIAMRIELARDAPARLL
jgi:hypothetical protein